MLYKNANGYFIDRTGLNFVVHISKSNKILRCSHNENLKPEKSDLITPLLSEFFSEFDSLINYKSTITFERLLHCP